ncbi:MAG: fibrobacter succinogenes major paralogous domain-containing protein, partial [Dysgonamonadaceae bacterium]|jgi:hypothetical protein|nr:fibrobacter succinogenes major paralogous domain-containing protein [Dysgonamonadaceae bacterium]
LRSELIEDATSDTLFIDKDNTNYGINEPGKVYQFYCVVVRGSQYGISGTGRVVYGTGARLANGGWIKVANANLGAVQTKPLADQIAYQPDADSSTVNDKAYDPTVYGDCYEWGRKKDGHENRKVLATNTVSIYVNSPNGVGLDSLDVYGQIQSDLSDIYGKFIQRNAGTNDWRQYPEKDGNFATAPANDWTWGNPAKGITGLDPCRSELGAPWRVPTQAEWIQIVSNNTWVWQESGADGTSGYRIKPGGTNKPTALFLPAAGYRTRLDGVQSGINIFVGYYWSSAVTGTNSFYLYFTSGSISTTSTLSRATGLAVRCVSE